MQTITASPPAHTLLIEGPDADGFVRTQFSSDTRALETGHWQFSAWLDPQGRVRALFHLARLDEQRWLLLCRGGDALSLEHELAKYIFRSRVTLRADMTRFIVDDRPEALYQVVMRNDSVVFGCGDHSLQLSVARTASAQWPLKQVRAGWPWLPPGTTGKLLPPSLSLHRLGAVALDKGCYPGQEIVARLHYRGGNKRHLYSVALSHALPDGTLLDAGEGHPGIQLLAVATSTSGSEALAILQDKPDGTPLADPCLTADGVTSITVGERWPA